MPLEQRSIKSWLLSIVFLYSLTCFNLGIAGYMPLDDKPEAKTAKVHEGQYHEGPLIEAEEEIIANEGLSKLVVSTQAATRAVKVLAISPSGDETIWHDGGGAGLVRRRQGREAETFGPAEGLLLTNIKKLQMTKMWVLALGADGAVQLFSRQSSKWFPPTARAVIDCHIVDGRLFTLRSDKEHILHKSLSEGGYWQNNIGSEQIKNKSKYSFVSDGERLYLWSLQGVYEITKEKCHRNSLLSRTQIVALALGKKASIACHGWGVYSLGEGEKWRPIKSNGGPKGDNFMPFILNDEVWIGRDGGLLSYSQSTTQWSYHKAENSFGPAGICAAAANHECRWFGSKTGQLYLWSVKEKSWSPISLYTEQFGEGYLPNTIYAMVAAKEAVYVASDVGLHRVTRTDKKLMAQAKASAPSAKFVCVAALSNGTTAFGDGKRVFLWDEKIERWRNEVIDEAAELLAVTSEGKLWCAAPGRLTRWSINPLHKERVIAIPREPLLKVIVKRGVLFALTTKRVFRVDVRTGTARNVWFVPPPLRITRGRWFIYRPTDMVIDSEGIIISRADGTIKRIFWFDKVGAEDLLAEFKVPKTTVTALTQRGASLYAALSGGRSGVWKRDVTEQGGQWKRIAEARTYGEGLVKELSFLGEGLIVRTDKGTAIVASHPLGNQFFDGSKGTIGANVCAMFIRGHRLWLAGRGFSLVQLKR